jgi:hypothetical protein
MQEKNKALSPGLVNEKDGARMPVAPIRAEHATNDTGARRAKTRGKNVKRTGAAQTFRLM